VAEKPSYLKAMLTSPANMYAGLGSGALGALLSLPFGFGVGLLPIILYAAGASIASLYVPSSGVFRAKVDADFRKQQRAVARDHLCREISQRVPGIVWDRNAVVTLDDDPAGRLRQRANRGAIGPTGNSAICLDAYQRMVDRVASLQQVAADRETQLSAQDIERLDDTTLDYLSLWLASLVTDDRNRAVDQDDVRQRIADLDAQLANAGDTPATRQLRHARADYSALLARQSAMLTKRQAIEAAMMAMPDQIEEIYQMIMAAPFSSSLSSKLDESLSRLRLEDELQQELNDDLHDSIPTLPVRPAVAAAVPAAAGNVKKMAAPVSGSK
jgi:hypothetical protein